MMVRVDGAGKHAFTEYAILEEFDGYVFAEIRPHTGRTHQIRVHMAKIRLPVACDSVYGRERRLTLSDIKRSRPAADEPAIISRQALHAWRIRFYHPRTREPLTFAADLPADMQALLEALRAYRHR
jgi:23S rRNA pseudouridine1911/1915/1917 synthase